MSEPVITTIDAATLRALREELLAAEARTLREHQRISAMRRELEALCAHDWIPQGHVGPYEHRTCRHCGAHDYVA